MCVFQETVVQPHAELEQRGAQELRCPAGRAHHQQEPIGRGGRVRHRTGGHHRRSAAVAVGQFAGSVAGPGVPHRARRTADRLQPVARVRQQPEHATVSRLSDEVSAPVRASVFRTKHRKETVAHASLSLSREICTLVTRAG